MSGTTTLGLPYPELTDDPNVPADMQALAEAVDTAVSPLFSLPSGDNQYTQVLTGHIAANSTDRKNVLTASFTLSRAQWVIVAARARVDNQTNSASGDGAISIVVDGSYDNTLVCGPYTIGPNGTINERQVFDIPLASVMLAAGAHTVVLQYDHDNVSSTHWVMGGAIVHNGRNFYPTSLTVIV